MCRTGKHRILAVEDYDAVSDGDTGFVCGRGGYDPRYDKRGVFYTSE
jgi:hypothetical protein